MASILQAIFFGHGNPMNAVLNNTYTDAWRRVGEVTTKPRAILSISAHWFMPGNTLFGILPSGTDDEKGGTYGSG